MDGVVNGIVKFLVLPAAFSFVVACKNQAPQKIFLQGDMLINEVAKGDAALLVDEQDQFPKGKPATHWTVKVPEGKAEWYLPANAVIDLKREYAITKICLYFGDSISGACRVNFGIPFRWIPLVEDSLARENAWNEYPVSITSRFLQVSKERDDDLREIILFGYPTEPLPADEDSTVQARSQVPIGEAIGVNTHYLDPLDKVQVGGIAREYHNWILNEGGFTKNYSGYPQNGIQWSPASPLQKEHQTTPDWDPHQPGGFAFDAYYKELKEAGITVFPCIQGTVPWLNGEGDVKSRHKPVLSGADPADPKSYQAHADFMYQYAARYGTTKVAEAMLKAAPNQEKKSGLRYIEYFENWNEPDGWWGGRTDYFTPYEYAAMSSADYDGHESAMGKNKGIKNADPNARLVMAGLAIPNVDYLRAMKFWFDNNRKDKKFVFDVLTVHHYCNEGGGQAVMSKGISPEEDEMKSVLKKVSVFRDQYFPAREVWLTEFGWDSSPLTPQSATTEERQAQWIVRAYLAAFASGMDRAMMYMLRDVDPLSQVQFTSSGLIGPVRNFSAKPSWYYVSTLRNVLTGLVFESERTSLSGEVIISKFEDLKNSKSVYVLWCPLENCVIAKYRLPVEGTLAKARLVSLKHREKSGVFLPLEIHENTIEVDVSGTPVFVEVQ